MEKGKRCKGCKLCVKGRKLVLYITGICSTKCKYCPLSDNRKNKDKIWANEWEVKSFQDVITEARLCKAKGCGVTGGDPLVRLSRTVSYIRLLKKEFGSRFHIHIYLPLTNVTEVNLKKLYFAGVDEIRFHPSLDKPKLWDRVKLASKWGWKIGIEIPVFPDKFVATRKMLESFSVDFINLNELEYSDTNAYSLKKYKVNGDSYGIKGSEKTALKLVSIFPNAHYCSSCLKDSVQMKNRLKLRAKSISKPFDKVTQEGTLVRGAIYFKSLKPGFDYKKRLSRVNKGLMLKKLEAVKEQLGLEFGFNGSSISIDSEGLRLLTSVKNVRKAKDSLKEVDFFGCVVEEYPTKDRFVVELEWL